MGIERGDLERPFSAYLAWGAICVIWGTTYLANKVGLGSFPPLLFCGVRFLTAGIVLQLVLRIGFRRSTRVPTPLALSGLLTMGVGTGLVVWSQQWLPTGLASVLVAGTPLWLVLTEVVVPGGTRPSRRAVLGLVVGLAGVVVIATQRPLEALRAEYLWAVGAVLVAGLGWSVGSILTRRHKAVDDPFALAAAQMTWGGAALVLSGLLAGERLAGSISPASAGAFAYLVVFGSLVAYVSYLHALKHLPVAFASTYVYVNPMLALWLGWLVLDEALTQRVLLASALVLVGLALTKERKQGDTGTRRRGDAGIGGRGDEEIRRAA